MLIVFFRSLLLALLLIIAIRLMGKRQLGEMEPAEFAVALVIADLAAVPMQEPGIPLLSGIVPILAVLGLELLLAGLSMRSVRLRRLLDGNPVLLMAEGRIIEQNLRRTRITVDELLEMLRQAGTIDLTEVWRAILETNGQLSVLCYGDLPPSMPMTLISDGRVISENLRHMGFNRKWLERQLAQRKLSVKQVFLFTQCEDGTQYWQVKS